MLIDNDYLSQYLQRAISVILYDSVYEINNHKLRCLIFRQWGLIETYTTGYSKDAPTLWNHY